MHAATDELPVVAFRPHSDLTAFHDLDVIGSNEASRSKAEFMIAQAAFVDFVRRAFEEYRVIVDVALVNADRLDAAEVGHDVNEIWKHEEQRRDSW